MSSTLTLASLQAAVAGGAAAIQRITRLAPVGEKVFPPTYQGGIYATETRHVAGPGGSVIPVETVLLDSVQSQANRMEMALLRAWREGILPMPVAQVDFAANTTDPVLQEVGVLTALEAPHRIFDAIFRDSLYEGQPFRKAGPGERITKARAAQATPIFETCPTALLFGYWDSTGPRGGLGAKVQRALVSEIVGYSAREGRRPTSRIDPLQIENNVVIFERPDGEWTVEEGDGKKRRPSEINHGNIVPTITDKDNKPNHGGVTISHAVQHAVLSLAALRRLRFPTAAGSSVEADRAGRTVIAALGLAALTLSEADGYDLRSRCLLIATPAPFEFVGVGGGPSHTLTVDESLALLSEAVAAARAAGLPWPTEPLTLTPAPNLAKLVSLSRSRAMVNTEE